MAASTGSGSDGDQLPQAAVTAVRPKWRRAVGEDKVDESEDEDVFARKKTKA